MKPKQLTALLYAIAITIYGFANNIAVTNVSLTGQNTINHTVQVQFTISWQNSWRVSAGPANWDAAWVFVKYRQGNGDWGHAKLNADGNHVGPAGSIINTGLLTPAAAFNSSTNPGIGAFIFRNANGSGTFTVTNAQLQWMYGANGLADNDVVDLQVFAIEHVYVPQGSFAVGDGLVDAVQFTVTTINTGNSTTAPAGSGSLGGQAGGYPTSQTAPTTSNWPNGFNGFYCMKYEITQQGYVDFLNTLNRSQQASRVETVIASGISNITNRFVLSNSTVMANRNCIRCDANIHPTAPVTFYCDYDEDGIGDETNDGKEIACGSLNWGDVAAYLHWSGLRPLTELEFEKCGRGNLLPFGGEYAWGNSIIDTVTAVSNAGLSSEEPNIGANAVFGNPQGLAGPIRVGSIAGVATSRQQAGSGYYGIMELSGNLYERLVYLESAQGKAFVGNHGNGILNSAGNTTNADWPASTSALGIGFRGGSYINALTPLRISDRGSMSTVYSLRALHLGGRGGRTVS